MGLQIALEILGVLIPLFHLLGIIFAAHAALVGRTSQGAIAWALSLIFFPYVALPLYLIFGRQKFVGYVEARRKGDRRIDHLADNLLIRARPLQSELSGPARERYGLLEKFSLIPFTRGNAGRLLIDGQATFDAIHEGVCLLDREGLVLR